MLKFLKMSWIFTVTASLCVLSSSNSFACADFLLTAKDGSLVVGRSLEFGVKTPAKLVVHPKGEKIQSKGPNNTQGMAWISKYSYLSLESFVPGNIIDGFNEKGLSFNVLWFPDVQYPTSTPTSPAMDFVNLGQWLLGNFESIDEIKTNLPKLQLWFHEVPEVGTGGIPPIHLSLHDNKGQSIVVEFIKGKQEIFDNPVGVLTNSPEFPWHLTNLRNYVNLSSNNSGPKIIDTLKILPTGQGTGLQGIPGDWTPPSRFIRVALFKQFIEQPKDSRDAVKAAFHILNTVDIPYGIVKSSQGTPTDYTQWITVADLKNLKLFTRTYSDLTIKEYDLKKLLTENSTNIKVLGELSPEP